MDVPIERVLLIQFRSDSEIRCAADWHPNPGAWASAVELHREGQFRMTLIASKAQYTSRPGALRAMKRLVKKIRGTKLSPEKIARVPRQRKA